MCDNTQGVPKPAPASPGETRSGSNLFENQYKAMEHSFDLPPWDELSQDEKQSIRYGEPSKDSPPDRYANFLRPFEPVDKEALGEWMRAAAEMVQAENAKPPKRERQ